MSLFSEEVKLVLQGKTNEELLNIQKNLNEKKQNITSERLTLSKTLRAIDKQLNDIDKNIQSVLKEIKRREEIEETRIILTEEIKKMDGFELLSEDEFCIITTKMDKTDYRKYNNNLPRWLDLTRIISEVISIKKHYTNWTLSGLSRGGQYDTMPPQTFYKFEFKDQFGNYFNVGGITFISC